MDQNNMNQQNERNFENREGNLPYENQQNYAENATAQRDPLPNYDYSNYAPQQPTYQQPMYQQPVYQQPMYQQPMYQQQNAQNIHLPELEATVGSAFGKSLAAVIMSEFPILSIIAIILGSLGLKGSRRADYIAAQHGIRAGGKNVAAKVLGRIGLILGIVMTVIWSYYFLMIIAIVGAN